MRAAGIDIGTTTISGVVLDTEAKKVLKAKTIQNGSFIKAEHEWEQIQDVSVIRTKACALLDELLEEFPDVADEFKDVKILAHTYSGGGAYDILTVDKEVKTPADLKGMTIRCEPDRNEFIKACGATPVNTPFSEVYSSLQKNMYDGMLIPTETLQSCNFAEVCKYCVKLNLSYASAPGHLMNMDTWNSLPDDIKEIIDSEEIRSVVEKANVEGFKSAEEGAMEWAEETYGTKEVVLTDQQHDAFMELVKEANLEKAKELDSKGLPGTEIVEALAKWTAEWK